MLGKRKRKDVSGKGKSSLEDPLEKIKEEVGSGVSELYSRYDCDYCQEDIPGLRVRCAECPDFDLCLNCFACGATNGKHKNSHPYLFMNNGGFPVYHLAYPHRTPHSEGKRSRLKDHRRQQIDGNAWNAREEVRLLDAVEQFGYGNWKDIANHIETKTPEQAELQYNNHYIHGLVGKHTWKEELRGRAIDHTKESSASLSSQQLPPLNISSEEAMLLGYMPHRDDYEDFDKETEALVSQIADKSVEDENLDVALKLAQCDIYERRLREQVRRKRVARDYQLVSKFYTQNPIVQIGSKINSLKINSQIRAVKRLADSGPSLNFMMPSKVCLKKELKVRMKELFKYRDHGLTKIEELIPFEKLRFKREFRLRRLANKNKPVVKSGPRLLPVSKDYSIKAILNPHAHTNGGEKRHSVLGTPNGGTKKKKPKKSKWSRRKEKTGRRLLIQQGCILTVTDRRDSTDSN
ncbi:TADA2B [Lepeophtheirus salmonis]|uniref:TADA2B n=1 Tax=Lepeophtheirus salmonis TaxID=72036 RepID=A0A7R8HAV0_LEPSM|nr:TADA2B [Lepeophtheirus salmonis]CAF2980945.1 TADA2B [Lepeophtheirus salmonis]